MADTAKPASPLSAQEQVRIRRERRQAKVREGGNSRLNRITATQSTDFRGAELKAEEVARGSPPTPQVNDDHVDPPEVDISQLHGAPLRGLSALEAHRTAHFAPSKSPEDELREAYMMDQLFGQRASSTANSSSTPGLEEQDMLMQLLQQISGAGGRFSGMEGMSPGMESMMSGMMGGMGGGMGGPQTAESSQDRWGIWWAILHTLGALLVSLWALKSNSTVFDGTEMSRIESANLARSEKPQLFWYFAVMELLLQSGRFVLEKGRPPQGSMLTTIAGFLPSPFSTYLSTLARYSVFLWTILADAGMVVFALGIASWWNSR